MRGVLILLVGCFMAGCYGSESLHGQADSTTDPAIDTVVDSDVLVDTDSPIDTIVEESTIVSECGNGIVETGEECDDGNEDNCDGCRVDCTWSRALLTEGLWQTGALVDDGVLCLPSFFTVEAWIRHGERTYSTDILSQGDHFFIAIGSINIAPYTAVVALHHISCASPDTCDLVSGKTLSESGLEEWHHVVATGRPSDDPHRVWELGYYFDGTWVGTGGGWHFVPELACVGPMVILGRYGGTIDEVRISDGEVYTSDFVPPSVLSVEENTIALWRFDNEVEGVVPDVSGNGYDVVLVDGTLVPDDCHLP
jgi:cysteine-rich repeat protein